LAFSLRKSHIQYTQKDYSFRKCSNPPANADDEQAVLLTPAVGAAPAPLMDASRELVARQEDGAA
jgi:hypothetical protein